jgi:type I restriction enzyme, S subunit
MSCWLGMKGSAVSEGKRLVPRLRFPEFLDADEWDLFPLSSFVESLDAGVSVNSGDRPAKKGEASVLKTSAVACGKFDSQENKVVLDEVEIQRLKESVCKNTVIISRMNTPDLVGANAYVEESAEDIFLPDRLWAAKPKPGISMRFISYILGSDRGRAALSKIASGSSGSMKNITKPDVLSLQVTAPGFVEQQKIADCLSSADELIAAQTRKVDALKTHKKGLMQQLFPREGETQPSLRFTEFQKARRWTLRKLSNFVAERSQYPEGKVPLYSLTIEDGVTPKTERYERSFLVNDETDAYKLVLPDDFAFNPMNLRFGAIGRHSGKEKVAVSKYYNIFFCDSSVDSRFCEIYFRSDALIDFYDTMAIGSLIEKRRVHFSEFLKFSIAFPNLSEQLRIASCLTSLGDVIATASGELNILKTHKKGLMQQLFPSAEAVEV